jgi:hypothetical protein
LDEWFKWVRDNYPSKTLVPFLGYHVEEAGGASQTGERGDGTGHIEIAQNYSTRIFYYTKGQSDLDEITSYLQEYYGLNN